jgi:predicted phosphodiesterase
MLKRTFNLPESFEESYEHCHVPPQYKNWLVLNDLHAPYHNNRAIEESLNYGIDKNIDAILLNGDVMDFYMLSKFNPDPRKRDFQQELLALEQMIDVLRNIAPVFYKLGNHEERYESYMIRNAPVLLQTREYQLSNLLQCYAKGVEIITDQKIVYVGRLPVLHGHEVRLSGVSVNPARSLFLKTKKTALCGHLHRTSQHNETTLDGKLISTWSLGHLGEEHPKYARINNWNHGIARVEVDGDGNFEVINIRIQGNKLFRS